MLALAHGGKAPLWVSVLRAAEAWGTPPWEIEDTPGALKWIMRQGVLDKRTSEIGAARGRKT